MSRWFLEMQNYIQDSQAMNERQGVDRVTVVRKANRMADGQISPKVAVPALAQLGVGLILVVLGAIPQIVKDDSTRSTLLTVGLAMLGGSGLTGGLGFAAKPGKVAVQE